MPLSFPSTPNLNDTYTSGSVTWVWNGYAWDVDPQEDVTFDDVYATTFHGVLDGNASTASALFSTRTINGVNFNGTANVQVPGARTSSTVPANPVTGDIWFNSESGITYIYYDSYWVQFYNNSLNGNSLQLTDFNVITSGPLEGGSLSYNSSTGTFTFRPANISITYDAAALTGDTLPGTVINSSLTSIGTLNSLNVTGTISAGTVATTSGNISTQTGNIISGNELSDSKGEVRLVPVNNQTAVYTLQISDHGKLIKTNSEVIIPANIFSVGQSIAIYNNSSGTIAITQGSGNSIYFSGLGLTGSRTLAQRGFCSAFCVGTNEFVITGAGLA